MTELDPSPQKRLGSLDGLRGYAALVVVIYHCLLLNLTFGNLDNAATWRRVSSGASSLFLFSPLHDLWNGTEAVSVFFVISGLVLVRSFLNKPRGGEARRWESFYPKRLIRLYVPIIASLALALVVVSIIARRTLPTGSYQFNILALGNTPAIAFHDLVFLPEGQHLNAPLWSMRPELACSLLLPLYVMVCRPNRIRPIVKLGLFSLIIVAATQPRVSLSLDHHGLAHFGAYLALMGAFGCGGVLAATQESLSRRFDGWSTWSWILLLGAALVGMNTFWTFVGFGVESPVILGLGQAITVESAVLLTFVILTWRRQALLLTDPFSKWLGQRSFSLYLVHFPIVLAIATLIGPEDVWAVLALGIAASLLAAESFYRVVEHPSHLLAQRVGQIVQRRPIARRASE